MLVGSSTWRGADLLRSCRIVLSQLKPVSVIGRMELTRDEGSDPGGRPRQSVGRGDRPETEAIGGNWRTPDPLARHEDVRRCGDYRVCDLCGLQSLDDQALFCELSS